MTVSALIRLMKIPTGDEVVVANFEAGTATGGWGIGVGPQGFKAWVSRESDGALQESVPMGLARFTSLGTILHQLVMVTLTVSGTTASLWICGELAQSWTIAGGMRPAVAGYVTIHRNRSASSPLVSASAAFCGFSYSEVAQAAVYQRNQFTKSQAAGRLELYVGTAASLYRVEGGYTDQGPAARSPLTEQGYIGTEALIPQWAGSGDGAAHISNTSNPHSVTAAQIGALPAPGGTTTANGIVTGSGTAGAAVAVSTTTLADLEPHAGVQSAHAGGNRLLAAGDHNRHQVLSAATVIQIPNTLPAGFSWTARMDGAFSVTFASGGSYLTPKLYGKTAATLADTLIHVFVESSTVAFVTIVEKVP